MKITCSPICSTRTTRVSISGLVLTVDGKEIDLSVIPEGGQAEAEDDSPLVGIVTREEVTIRYEYDGSLAEPNQSTELSDYVLEVTDGVMPSPIIWKPLEQEPADV